MDYNKWAEESNLTSQHTSLQYQAKLLYLDLVRGKDITKDNLDAWLIKQATPKDHPCRIYLEGLLDLWYAEKAAEEDNEREWINEEV